MTRTGEREIGASSRRVGMYAYRIGLLFKHKNGDFGAISVTERSCTTPMSKVRRHISLVFSVTPFKIDQNMNQNRSIDKVQNLGNERRYIYRDPRQDSGQKNILYTRYPKKCFTQTYRDLYGDAMLVLTRMSSNMADGNQQKHLLPNFATEA